MKLLRGGDQTLRLKEFVDYVACVVGQYDYQGRDEDVFSHHLIRILSLRLGHIEAEYADYN